MKKTFIAAALAALSFGAFAHHVDVSASGSNQVSSSSGASAQVVGTGASFSQASNIQSASSTVGVSGNVVGTNNTLFGVNVDHRAGTVGVSGAVTTAGASEATNISIGAGATGSAAAAGSSVANVSGSGLFVTTGTGPAGDVKGNAGAVTESYVAAGRNGAAGTIGAMDASFSAGAAADLVTTNVPALHYSNDVKNAGTDAVANAIGGNLGAHNAAGSVLVNNTTGVANAGADATVNGVVSTTLHKQL